MATTAEPYARIGVGWAGSYVMTRAFARALPGGPAIAVIADMLNRMDLLATGQLDLTWVFPRARADWAYLGHRQWPDSPWDGAPLRDLTLVARFPRADRELIAIAPWSRVAGVAEIARRKDVRIALRTDELYEYESAIFQQYGFSLTDIAMGGGRYWHISPARHELDEELRNHEVDVVIGHASTSPIWRALADQGFRFTGLEEPAVEALERQGFERQVLAPGALPGIPNRLLTLDLSDQLLMSRASFAEDVIYEIAKSIDVNKRGITESGQGQTDAITRQWETKLVPLHKGAARYYREAGYVA